MHLSTIVFEYLCSPKVVPKVMTVVNIVRSVLMRRDSKINITSHHLQGDVEDINIHHDQSIRTTINKFNCADLHILKCYQQIRTQMSLKRDSCPLHDLDHNHQSYRVICPLSNALLEFIMNALSRLCPSHVHCIITVNYLI